MENDKPKRNMKAPRAEPPTLPAGERLTSPDAEVVQALSQDQVTVEALRCLQCKDPKCVTACPIHVPIKLFIQKLSEGDVGAAFAEISVVSPFPGICGRVCQHELFCEKACLMGIKYKPVAIGALERFTADSGAKLENAPCAAVSAKKKVALVGSGPASLMCAFELSKRGYAVTVFEALHELGGVLSYGIPAFRLPREVISTEIERLRSMGVEFVTNTLVGQTVTLTDLFEEGFSAIFVATGAGLPHLMGIPGENLVGVYTANEFLTRINLMEAYKQGKDTPIRVGKRTVIVGGGNAAMDAARWARRFGSESTIVYRRSKEEMTARAEEVEQAEHEGVEFRLLTLPKKIIGNDKGEVTGIEFVKMELGEPDASGRRKPVEIPGSEFTLEAETVVMAIGQSPNPTVQKSVPELETAKGGKIKVSEFGETNIPMVFAGGDVSRGGATVILALRDGRAAAETIDKMLQAKEAPPVHTVPAETAVIVEKKMLNASVAWFRVASSRIAKHAKPGQFVVLRPTPESERIPITIADTDPEKGLITLVIQAIGKTSHVACALEVGGTFHDLLGPLGKPSHIEKFGRVYCLAGGVGVAELLPVVKALRAAGNRVVVLCGARTKDLMILQQEISDAADGMVFWATDDGSFGFKGTVLDLLKDWQKKVPYADIDLVHVIGPIPMMRAVSTYTNSCRIKTVASLNPIMVDGTGMCGGCRVTVGSDVRFACVDGPEFDAHGVDWDELIRRNRAYLDKEKEASNSIS